MDPQGDNILLNSMCNASYITPAITVLESTLLSLPAWCLAALVLPVMAYLFTRALKSTRITPPP